MKRKPPEVTDKRINALTALRAWGAREQAREQITLLVPDGREESAR